MSHISSHILKLILTALILCSNCLAIPYGQDTLGAAQFSVTNLQNLPAGQGQGHFTNTFGDIVPLIRKEAARGVPFIRLHLMWKDRHDFTAADFPAIKAEASRVCPVIIANPQVKWYLSGACEHHLNESLARQLAQIVTAACPEAEYVNTPAPQGAVLQEYINETHGIGKPRSRKYAFSFDGTAAEDSNIEKFKRLYPDAKYFMVWGPRYNGRWESNDSTPRPLRTGYADGKYIQSMAYLTTSRGVTQLPPRWTWKSHSENKGNGDWRAEKPVAIIPLKVPALALVRNGKLIGRMEYYGPFSDGRSRYYIDKWGFELGRVDIMVKKKKFGTVNSGFRDGDYR